MRPRPPRELFSGPAPCLRHPGGRSVGPPGLGPAGWAAEGAAKATAALPLSLGARGVHPRAPSGGRVGGRGPARRRDSVEKLGVPAAALSSPHAGRRLLRADDGDRTEGAPRQELDARHPGVRVCPRACFVSLRGPAATGHFYKCLGAAARRPVVFCPSGALGFWPPVRSPGSRRCVSAPRNAPGLVRSRGASVSRDLRGARVGCSPPPDQFTEFGTMSRFCLTR